MINEYFSIIRILIIGAGFFMCFWCGLIVYFNVVSNLKNNIDISSILKIALLSSIACITLSLVTSALFLKINLIEYFIPAASVTEAVADAAGILNEREELVANSEKYSSTTNA